MCLFSQPSTPTVTAPTEYAQQQQPDGAAVKDAVGRRTSDQVRSATSTVLTSGSGVTTTAPTDKKTLLGQ